MTMISRVIGMTLLASLAMSTLVFAASQNADELSESAATVSESSSEDREDKAELPEVSVTGSLLRSSDMENASPVSTISSEDIDAAGFKTVRDILITASQATGQVDTEMDMVGSTPNGQFVNLRGLGPQYTLVLLNGKRMADYPQAYGFRSTAVSLNSVPVAAIDRIEILSGGASAIYGSDAVAGVINIITKSDYDSHDLRLRAGTATRGGGNSYTLEFSGGKWESNWSTTYALQYQKNDPVMAYQRDFMSSTFRNPAFRDDPSRAPATTAVALVQVDDDGNETYMWPGADGNLSPSTAALNHACSSTNPGYIAYRELADDDQINRCGDPDYNAQRTISNGVDQISGMVSGSYQISPDIEAYYTATASISDDTAYNTTMY